MDRGQSSGRGGFSLMEAMVVLIVAGMALMLVFAVGGRATQLGFRLGGQALGAVDGELAEANVRTVMAAMTLRPAGVAFDPMAADAGKASFAGGPASFQGDAVLARASLCGGAGPAHALRVDIKSLRDGDAVLCRVGAGPSVVLADLRPRRARFAYSTDGRRWSDRWIEPTTPSLAQADGPREQALFIRLATVDGAIDITDRSTSGRPDLAKATAAAPPVAPGPL